MTRPAYDKEITALLVIDPYNDFISEGGKVWGRIRAVAEANDCVPHMLQVLSARERRNFGSSMQCIVATVRATTRPGSTLRRFRSRPGRTGPSNTARGVGRSVPGSSPGRARSSPRSIGVRAASPTRIWICNSRSTAFSSSSSWGSSPIHASKRPFALPLSSATGLRWYRDATADYSDKEMHAALDVNIPRYASAIVTAQEIVDLLSSAQAVDSARRRSCAGH